jgi:uncharacterized membrane protein
MENNTDDIYKVKRFFEIDFFKGLATIFMIIFHFFYLMYLMDIVKFEIKQGLLHAIAKISHTIFILMVGINSAISYNKFKAKNKKLYENDYPSFRNQYIGKVTKRALFLLVAGFIMSILSYFGFGNLFVKFGIFHFIGVALFLSIPIVSNKFASLATTAIICMLYVLSNTPRLKAFFSRACGNTPILCFISGVYNIKFSSLDHFSIIPYFGLVTFGIFLGHVLYTYKDRKFLDKEEEKKFDNYEKNNVIKNVGLLGKNSFIIYFFHFVLFYFLLIGYKYQLKPRLDVFMSQNKVSEKIDTLEGSDMTVKKDEN